MDTLAVIARRRAVMTTIADAIVAAAAGRSLRVAVGCTHHDEIPFADQLTQALYARGRPCRCLPMEPAKALRAENVIVAVIVSGGPSPEESGLCRVDIQLRRPGLCADDVGCRADIVVEYLPEGPVIRHLAAHLAPAPERS